MVKYAVFVVIILIWIDKIEGNCDFECITDLNQNDCPPKNFLDEGFGPSGCCVGCNYYPLTVNGDRCQNNSFHHLTCPPGSICNSGRICEVNLKSCLSYLHLKEEVLYPKKCNLDGTYAAVHCKGDNVVGRCYCTDEDGNRIYGMAWASEAEDMTCACSRKRNSLLKSGRNNSTLHCTENGNYEELQCDSGFCWCANQKTGDPVSTVVSDNLVFQLPCFNPDTFGSMYMRICESKAIAINGIINRLKDGGTSPVTMEMIYCDYDGSYGVFQVSNGIAYCSWKDGSRIGSYQMSVVDGIGTMKCNCARDMKYFEEQGKVMMQACSGNGNYMSLQHLDGRPYCVDSDGFPTTDLKPLGEKLTCP